MKRFLVKVTFHLQALLIAFLLGKFTYGFAPDTDGFGIFVPNVGGYHVSLLNQEDTGFFQ